MGGSDLSGSRRSDQIERELFDRSVDTLAQSWAYLATGSQGAEVIEASGAVIAVFVQSFDREIFNNAVLERGGASRLGAALDAVERTYSDRGIERYAVWVHESEEESVRGIEARGFGYDSSTRTMAMNIADLAHVDTSKLELAGAGFAEFRRIIGAPDDLLSELSVDGLHIYFARLEGEIVSTLTAFDHNGDCGIYNVGTVSAARRRGIATALTAFAIAEARERGCITASLQSTEMAEGVYARVGFRDLGRFHEYVPGR